MVPFLFNGTVDEYWIIVTYSIPDNPVASTFYLFGNLHQFFIYILWTFSGDFHKEAVP
jgi:hypothetical protein